MVNTSASSDRLMPSNVDSLGKESNNFFQGLYIMFPSGISEGSIGLICPCLRGDGVRYCD